jgi:hypothetical protein
LIRLRPKCGLDRVSSLKSCFAPNWILRWHDRVTDEAGWRAMKKEAALQATATVAERGR